MDINNRQVSPYGNSFSNGQNGMDKAVPNGTEGSPKSYKGILGFIKGSWVSGKTAPVDVLFFVCVFILLCLGLTMVFSASYTYSYYYQDGNALFYFLNQAKFCAGGLVAMWFISHFDYRKLNCILCPLFFAGTLLLLAITFVVNFKKDSDFKRWLTIGSVQFQPSELAKIALIMMFAFVVSRTYKSINSPKSPDGKFWQFTDRTLIGFAKRIIPSANVNSLRLTIYYALLICAVCVLIIIENHLSCTILVFLIGISMMWLAGVKKGYFVILAIVAAIVVTAVILKPDILPGYAADRIIAWLDKDYDPLDKRWQTNQSVRAIASGGPFGLGLGNSRQKHLYVSEPQNDFIFAIVCEEFGFVGSMAILALFGVLVWRGFAIAKKANDVFGAFIAMGICLQVGLQVILNVAVVTDSIPNTGISLPFFSSGGTALLVLLAEMGLVLSVSRRSKIEKV